MSTDSTDLGVLLAMAYGAFKDRLHEYLAAQGYDDLGPSFGFVFRALAQSSLSLVELSEQLGITAQGAHKLVTEMVERRYLERVTDEADARVRRVQLSARGKAALRAARRFHATAERQLVESLGATKVAGARTVLEAMAAETADGAARLRPF